MSLVLAPPLLVLAVASGLLADRWLAGATWTTRSPGAAIRTWHAVAVACVGALLAAATLLAHDVLEVGLRAVTSVDRDRLHAVYFAGRDTVDGLWNLTILLAVALVATTVAGLVRVVVDAARTHRSVESSLPRGPRCRHGDAILVESLELFAFSTPRHVRAPGHVVVSTAVVDRLPTDEVAAVVAHEVAHRRRRHHRSVATARVLAGAVGPLGLLRHHRDGVARLVELQADDDAARATSPEHVARALLSMSTAARPGLAMASSPTGTADRVRRLVGPAGDSSVTPAGLVTWTASLAALVPPLCVLGPLLLLR